MDQGIGRDLLEISGPWARARFGHLKTIEWLKLRTPSQPDADPATLAFEALRAEVALVRRAVAGLSADRASIEIPDYSETLGQIMRGSAATAHNLKALAEMSALRRSAKDWGREIAFAAEDARRSDRQAFAHAPTRA
jgi:hypothetical protein